MIDNSAMFAGFQPERFDAFSAISRGTVRGTAASFGSGRVGGAASAARLRSGAESAVAYVHGGGNPGGWAAGDHGGRPAEAEFMDVQLAAGSPRPKGVVGECPRSAPA
jgi:hypothetical protein